MSRSTVVAVRFTHAERDFLDEISKQKGVSRSSTLHNIFLQHVALSEISKTVEVLLDKKIALLKQEIIEIRQDLGQSLKKEDLVKATNFIIKEVKK